MTPSLLLLACSRAPSEVPAEPTASAARTIEAAVVRPRRTVCPGSGDYETIQSAISGVAPGTMILVCAGTYSEDLTIRKAVGLRAQGAVTIQGTGADTVIDVNARGRVSIQGFTITGGSGVDGGGIAAAGANTVVAISGNTITGNLASGRGGGIWLDQVDGTVTDNVISDNEANEGGGINAYYADVTIEGNDIAYNRGTTTDDEAYGNGSGGGGLFLIGGGSVVDNDIHGNDSDDNGGGLFWYVTTGETIGNRVYDNTTWGDGAGLYYTWSIDGLVDGNEIWNNDAGDDGGGMRVYRGGLTITNNDYHDNVCAEDGGGMKVSHEENVIDSNTFTNNVAGEEGGGLELDNEKSDVSNCTFVGNTANRGGGLHSWDAEAQFTLSNLWIEDNDAVECGGALAVDNDPLGVAVRNVTMIDNTAPDGAAFCMTQEWVDDEETETYDSVVHMQNVLVVDNVASDDAGAFDVEAGLLTVRNSTITGSRLGAIDVEDGDITIDSSIFANGGGPFVNLDPGGSVTFRYSLFWNNRGGWGDISDPTGSDGNISGDPEFTAPMTGDYSLDTGSIAIDAGNPMVSDTDGSRADIGVTGGPYGI
jgi:parallel beta-helix repeat protein